MSALYFPVHFAAKFTIKHIWRQPDDIWDCLKLYCGCEDEDVLYIWNPDKSTNFISSILTGWKSFRNFKHLGYPSILTFLSIYSSLEPILTQFWDIIFTLYISILETVDRFEICLNKCTSYLFSLGTNLCQRRLVLLFIPTA